FRLGPRINAAGRLGHPRAALHLLLTDDAEEARLLADTLEELNHERQAVEGRILREAVAQVEQWPDADKRRRAYVVAGEDWHEGVIGIVASRLVERFNRPVVLIAGGDGEWKGSGRSIASFDLHGGLGACSELLERWGGHRAAAGLSIKPENVEAFAEAFAEHAAGLLVEEDVQPVTRIDAVVPRGTQLTLELCDWLVAEYRKPADKRDGEAAAIFAELEIETAGLGRRHLLESERFRALLSGEPALARAA